MKNTSLKKSSRLLKRREFETVSKRGDRLFGKFLCIEVYLRTHSDVREARLGVTVTKKFGKSHDRNRFKRLVREAFRLSKERLLEFVDLVIRPKGKFPISKSSLKMQQILLDLNTVLRDFRRS